MVSMEEIHSAKRDGPISGPCLRDRSFDSLKQRLYIFLSASFVRLVRSNRFCRSRVCNITRQRPALLKARSRTSCEDIELPGVLR